MATQEEVAGHLRLTARQLRRLQKLPGSPVSKKRGDLDVDEWRYFYLSYLQRNRNSSRRDDEGDDEDYDEKLLIARTELTSEQAISQRLKNQIAEQKVIDTEFCIFALSRLAGELASVLDSIPLSMQRRFPELTERHLDYLRGLVAKGANKCVESSEKITEFADEYYRDANQ